MVYAIDRASFNQGQNAKYDFEITDGGINSTLTAQGPSAVAYGIGNGQANQSMTEKAVGTLNCMHDQQAVVYGMDCRNGRLNGNLSGTLQAKPGGGFSYNCTHSVLTGTSNHYIVRRLTPTECARLQGFPDWWGHIAKKDDLTDEDYRFWLDVRNTHARINGKAEKEYTKKQILAWYNKLHTDSAEYKMWGNGIALPPALYCLEGIVEAWGKEVAYD